MKPPEDFPLRCDYSLCDQPANHAYDVVTTDGCEAILYPCDDHATHLSSYLSLYKGENTALCSFCHSLTGVASFHPRPINEGDLPDDPDTPMSYRVVKINGKPVNEERYRN